MRSITGSLLLAAVLTLGACTSSDGASIEVVGTDDSCTPATDTAAAGDVGFEFRNEASQVSELYVLRADGSVASEVENVAPQTSRRLTVSLTAGTYTLNCKPGQTGDGFSSPFTVTGEGGDAAPTSGIEVEVRATEFAFAIDDAPAFAAGETYTFELINEGTMAHELEVFAPDGDAIGEVPPTPAGDRGTVTLTLDEPGTYRLVCGIAGHEASGMALEIAVA